MRGIRDMRYVRPTPIQAQVIRPILEGRDVVANAQTGSGKTAAFLLPLMDHAVKNFTDTTQILILAPTRELACQIDEHALGFGYHTSVKSIAVYGGVRMENQEQALRENTSIVVATPGRLLDHQRYGSWRFDNLKAVVFDEADRMLDMGFWPDVKSIMDKLPQGKKRQMLLFSATMPGPIEQLAKQWMHDPARIKIGLQRPPTAITQMLYPVAPNRKEELLIRLLKEKGVSSTLVFVGTKTGADRLKKRLDRAGFHAGVIHGDREQKERDRVMNEFRSGSLELLVATDVASRGIDVSGISHVINFDVPHDTDTYIHRIGRTARAEAVGEAYTLYTREDEYKIKAIERVLGRELPRETGPESTPSPHASGSSQRHGSGSSHGRRPHSGPRRSSSGHHSDRKRRFNPGRRPAQGQ
ncbi:MAG: DEAD/DEAH box helicase [Candidatus Omnitrophica bacterium]|nr:DEAD/DEAH box helicase [Candidatus Omnitrophota bacterium]